MSKAAEDAAVVRQAADDAVEARKATEDAAAARQAAENAAAARKAAEDAAAARQAAENAAAARKAAEDAAAARQAAETAAAARKAAEDAAGEAKKKEEQEAVAAKQVAEDAVGAKRVAVDDATAGNIQERAARKETVKYRIDNLLEELDFGLREMSKSKKGAEHWAPEKHAREPATHREALDFMETWHRERDGLAATRAEGGDNEVAATRARCGSSRLGRDSTFSMVLSADLRHLGM